MFLIRSIFGETFLNFYFLFFIYFNRLGLLLGYYVKA